MERAADDRLSIPIMRLAQCLSSITVHQNPWHEVGKSVVSFLGASLVAFGERRQDGTVSAHHFCIANAGTADATTEPMIREAIEEVLESGFLTTRILTDANHRLKREIAERRRAEEEARHLAYHDSLTGLPNRLLFNEHLELALAHARRTRGRAALMMLDLDEFKSVNDSYGHAAGDDLLRSVADRLRALVRESDTVARIGGDEFALILPDVSDYEAPARIAGKLVAGLRAAFTVDGVSVRVGASAGISVYPDDGTDGDTLMRCADMDMYRAKGSGSSTA